MSLLLFDMVSDKPFSHNTTLCTLLIDAIFVSQYLYFKNFLNRWSFILIPCFSSFMLNFFYRKYLIRISTKISAQSGLTGQWLSRGVVWGLHYLHWSGREGNPESSNTCFNKLKC